MCSICGRNDGLHDYRCPYYSPPHPKYLCCYCGEGIYQGGRYLDNENGEYMHEDCIGCLGTDRVINWLGFKYKEMEDYDE